MPTDPITTSRIILLFLTISLLLFVFLAFFTVYYCRSIYIRRRHAAAANFAPPPLQSLEDAPVGLDPSLVASFPTFTYSWVMKNLHAGKHGLECAVCLSDFLDDDVLRLLTVCSHVFHTDCIDVWLMSHTTCPYCRHELNPEEKKTPEVRILMADAAEAREVIEEMHAREEDEPHPQRRSDSLFKEGGQERREWPEAGVDGRRNVDLERVMRSNSTGHSSLGTEYRFTLKMSKDVKERIARVRNWTGSCVDFRELFLDLDDTKEETRWIELSGSSKTCHSRM